MNYAELKKSYDTARREQLNVNKEITRISKELTTVDESKTQIHSQFEKLLINDKAQALERHRKSKIAPIEQKLTQTEDDLSRTKEEYDALKSEITYDNLLAQCSSKQDILTEVREASKILQQRLEGLVGKRFYHVLAKTLDKQQVNFDSGNLDKLIDYFNSSERTIEKYESGGKTFSDTLTAIEDIIFGDNPESVKISSISSILILGILLFCGKYCIPVVALLMVIFVLYNTLRNYSVYRILVIQKAVQDNIDSIDAHLKAQIEEEVSRQQTELNQKYLPKIDELECKVQELQQLIYDTSAEADMSFQHDSSKISLSKQAELEKLEKQQSVLLVQKSQQEELLKQKTKIVEELGNQLNGLLDNLKHDFLSGVGSSVVFDPHFLFDIDIAKNKPVFFNHPQTSCLFLYEDDSDVYDLIRLFSVELRAKLNPFCLNIVAVDEKYAGQNLIYFTTVTDEKNSADVSSIYKLITNETDVKQLMIDTAQDFIRRLSIIRRDFEDIVTYNTKMIELNSLTETYEFQFVVDPSQNYLNDNSIKQVLRVGGTLGLYTHLFITKDEFVNMKDGALDVLDVVGKVYYLENDNFFERAKDFVVEHLLSQEG